MRLLRYFTPHFFSVLAGVAFSWSLRWLLSLDGSCRAFCHPPVALSMGVLGGLLGAQLYRSDHPLPARFSEPRAPRPAASHADGTGSVPGGNPDSSD